MAEQRAFVFNSNTFPYHFRIFLGFSTSLHYFNLKSVVHLNDVFCCCFLFRSVSHCLADRLHSYSHSLEEMDKRVSIYWISWLRERVQCIRLGFKHYIRVFFPISFAACMFCFAIKCVCGVCWKGVVKICMHGTRINARKRDVRKKALNVNVIRLV